MTVEDYERCLDQVVTNLGDELRSSKRYHEPEAFQRRAFEVLEELVRSKLNVSQSVAPKDRISEWLKRADAYARDWVPSEELFTGD